MNGDLQELMEHISGLHNQQMTAISDLGREFSEHKGAVETKLVAIEKEQDNQDRRQWIHSFVVIPVLALLHGIAHHFGIQV